MKRSWSLRLVLLHGIDMATREELIAADKTVEEIHADSLAYLSREAVTEVLETDRSDLCMGCVTSEYPYDIAGEETDRSVGRPTIEAAMSADD